MFVPLVKSENIYAMSGLRLKKEFTAFSIPGKMRYVIAGFQTDFLPIRGH
jgi:hypothetical protein